MAIDVVKPGFATTVQDLGRPGYYHLGIPLSGAMDRYALRAANLLVGNDEGDAGLEAVFIGPELRFTSDASVAITGAELPPKVDGEVTGGICGPGIASKGVLGCLTDAQTSALAVKSIVLPGDLYADAPVGSSPW